MNKVMLIGRLTKVPELRSTPNGKQVCEFTLATNRINNEDADFISCIVWEKQAENLCKYQTKGSLIGIIGQLRTTSYEKEGVRKYKTYVLVSEIEYLSSVSHKEENEGQSETNPFAEMNTKVESDIGQQIESTDDDLPF